MTWKRRSCVMLVCAFTALALGGCGGTTGSDKPADQQAADQTTTEQASDKPADSGEAGTESSASAASSVDDVVGEWEYMCNINHGEYSDGDSYDYVTMCTDEMAPVAKVKIRKEGDAYLVDYRYQEYEYYSRVYGAPLTYKTEAAFAEAENQDWCLEFEDPFEEEGDTAHREHKFYLTDDTLVLYTEYRDESDGYSYHSTNKEMYLRKDSPKFDDAENLRYFDTVTVSTALDLVNSLQNNRKIYLEGGTYNLSTVPAGKVSNPAVSTSYNTYDFKGLSNLCLEAKDGAKVEILVDDPYSQVISFQDGRNITLRGLTVGHNVEPGYCSGSVLGFNTMNNVDIEGCKLYGSGTYGIEASSSYNMRVKDTEIYECTYGLVNLYSVSSATFTGCTMRDSSDLSMIELSECYDILFEDCAFNNNRSNAFSNVYFVNMGEYDRVTFKNCSFKNNEFNAFANREVTMENCTADNNRAGFNEMIDSSGTPQKLDKDTILRNYDSAVRKQEEIDAKLKNDALLDQLSLNQIAYEEYDLWDTLLNQIWSYLTENLETARMDALREEQQKWIVEKEASMKAAAADFEGGSMKPMIEYGNGATTTRKRVEELLKLVSE